MNYRIVFEDGTVINQPTQAKSVLTPIAVGRDWKKIDVICDVDTIKTMFVDNVKYRQEWDSVKYVAETKTIEDPETGESKEVTELVEVMEVLSKDLSDYCVAGEVVDHRDGTCTVLMGRLTEIELLQSQIDEKPSYDDMAAVIMEGVNSIE